MTTAIAPKPVSDAQRDLIVRLAIERGMDPEQINFDELTGGGKGSASKLISSLFKMPKADGSEATPRNWDPESGLYRRGEDLFKVTISRTGNWYAEIAILPTVGSGRVNLDWDYIGRRVNLKEAQRMSDAEAGQYFHFCIRCGAPLTDPDSIARGIGPVCATKGL